MEAKVITLRSQLTPHFVQTINSTIISQYQKDVMLFERPEEIFYTQDLEWRVHTSIISTSFSNSARVMSLRLKSLKRDVASVSVLVQYTTIHNDFSMTKGRELLYNLEDETIPITKNTIPFDREKLLILQITIIEKCVCECSCSVSRNFGDLFAQGKLTDITLVVGDKEFKAHKVILALHSPVFMATFEHDMQEKQENRVVIENVDSDVFYDMLKFMYNVENFSSETDASELLVIADRYQFTKLKEVCENVMVKSISIDNALDSLIFADKYDSKNLKQKTIKFIINHLNEIVYKPQFDEIMNGHGYLATILFQEIAKKQCNNNC